jgi:uncharacterized membrane protein
MQNFGAIAFAIGMIASGALNLVNRDFYAPWDPVPGWVPAQAHVWLACLSGVVMVLGGVGLMVKPVAARSARVLFAHMVLFLIVLKTPVLLADPKTEVLWLNYGQIAVLAAGALALAATNDSQVRVARYLLGASLLPIGLSHFVYLSTALPMVPAMLPFHPAWVIFTGSAHIAAGLALLVGVWPRLAAMMEAGMITSFALFVWVLPILGAPRDISRWVELIVTVAVAGGVWAVASRIPSAPRAPTVAHPVDRSPSSVPRGTRGAADVR